MGDVTVRPATPADRAAWLPLRHALWPEAGLAEHAREIDDYFAGRDTLVVQVLLAETRDGRACGFVELSLRPYAEGCSSSPVAYLEGWYVAPEGRRRGAGAALIRASEGWARGRGCTEFASDALLTNDVSAAAHRALGFEEVEQIRCFRKAL
jgi:aminoglycoside 6'-N-acetyltransferase I